MSPYQSITQIWAFVMSEVLILLFVPRLTSCKSDTPQDDQGHPHLDSLRLRVPDLVKNENHSLQTHVVNMEYFEKSAIIR